MYKEAKSTSTTTSNEPPGHDIFCTPENSEFLFKVHYKDLNASDREIRLLKILPESRSGFVECELLPSVKLADVHKQYLALSYCAGDARKTKPIIVNGARCNVFANLHHALTTVRHYWETHTCHRDLFLWVDQICINQANLIERSHQVGFMRAIYESASETLICLSVAETRRRDAMACATGTIHWRWVGSRSDASLRKPATFPRFRLKLSVSNLRCSDA